VIRGSDHQMTKFRKAALMGRFDSLWIEKYRPSIIDDLVLTPANRAVIDKFITEGDIPQLLFIGSAGIGKTSLAKILTNNILQCQYLYINASDENGIDTIRSKVTNFSKTKSYDGSIKVIILDEVDGLTLDAQRCLRNTMEEYSEFTRFILTANYRHKVIPPLQSRCQSLDLIPPQDMFISRCMDILNKENCENIEPAREDIIKLCKRYYPDLRRAVNELQKSVISNKFTVVTTDKKDIFVRNIYNCVQTGKTLKARKLIIENEDKFDGDYQELLHQLFNHIHTADVDDDKKRQQLLITGEHIYRSAFVADQEINFYSCCLAL
jgi:DNA polymerase III delta prime subunit